MVSRFPRGICRVRANVVGITVTRRPPRSILRHRSSTSGVSPGTSRSDIVCQLLSWQGNKYIVLPSTVVIWTNLSRCWVVVKIRWIGVTRKDVQFFARSRLFAKREPDLDMENNMSYQKLVTVQWSINSYRSYLVIIEVN